MSGVEYARIKYSKKNGLIHIIDNFSISCYDYKTSKKRYSIQCHLQIGDFEYDKDEGKFMLTWSGVDLLAKPKFFPDHIVARMFGVYDINDGNLIRIKRVSVSGELLALHSISEYDAAFISVEGNQIKYGVFRGGTNADLGEIQINGSVFAEGRVGVPTVANILASKDGNVLYQINSKFY
jgi:hypothetical protein